MEHSTGLIQAIIFEAADRDNIGGSAYGGQRSICCTPDLAKLEGCKQGEVIKRPSAEDLNWPIVFNLQFSGNYLSTVMDSTEVYITKTGMYNLFFISCDPKLKGLVMSGKTLWKNPDGYLPGRMAPLMKFYVFMSLAYILLSVIWFSQYVRFWKDILQIQNCITLVIALGLFEMTLWYFEHANFNNTGMRPVGITTWVVTIGAVRKTVSRLLILSVSMGYGVVRPTLGGLTSKVLLLGITYFLASESLDIAENVGTINDISGKARLFLVLPDAFLDAFLILWIFTSLSKTLEQLQAKRSSVKLDIYRKFSNALAVAVIASVAWIGYERFDWKEGWELRISERNRKGFINEIRVGDEATKWLLSTLADCMGDHKGYLFKKFQGHNGTWLGEVNSSGRGEFVYFTELQGGRTGGRIIIPRGLRAGRADIRIPKVKVMSEILQAEPAVGLKCHVETKEGVSNVVIDLDAGIFHHWSKAVVCSIGGPEVSDDWEEVSRIVGKMIPEENSICIYPFDVHRAIFHTSKESQGEEGVVAGQASQIPSVIVKSDPRSFQVARICSDSPKRGKPWSPRWRVQVCQELESAAGGFVMGTDSRDSMVSTLRVNPSDVVRGFQELDACGVNAVRYSDLRRAGFFPSRVGYGKIRATILRALMTDVEIVEVFCEPSRSTSKQQIHSVNDGRALGLSLPFGTFLPLHCSVLYAIFGLHLRALNGALYAYSDEVGEEFDDEEAQSLTRGAPEGDISLVKQEKNVGDNGVSDLENDTEEDKRE
ncbi:hypothetical protein HHK36_004379 [Tetracentron sinense]|uniref:GOST seven transmembrane domain-containing protein n=1 Tax=Tetracentron sinense TaxID=13715 RepID=A0A834ZUT5_TETSI|nr:hypothetical protein HHK36_004379 [Tetracentron sinense]